MRAPPEEDPPAGGYGGGAPGSRFGPSLGPRPSGPKESRLRAAVRTLATVGAGFLLLSTLGVLGIFTVRKYLIGSKSAEAKNSIGQMAKDASNVYEAEIDGSVDHRLCPSASFPVPREASLIRGTRYQSSPLDWDFDAPRNAGFACLRFSMSQPQSYQYRYQATPSSFLAGARGDLDGDGRLSDFTLKGEVRSSRLVVSPTISETDPEE